MATYASSVIPVGSWYLAGIAFFYVELLLTKIGMCFDTYAVNIMKFLLSWSPDMVQSLFTTPFKLVGYPFTTLATDFAVLAAASCVVFQFYFYVFISYRLVGGGPFPGLGPRHPFVLFEHLVTAVILRLRNLAKRGAVKIKSALQATSSLLPYRDLINDLTTLHNVAKRGAAKIKSAFEAMTSALASLLPYRDLINDLMTLHAVYTAAGSELVESEGHGNYLLRAATFFKCELEPFLWYRKLFCSFTGISIVIATLGALAGRIDGGWVVRSLCLFVTLYLGILLHQEWTITEFVRRLEFKMLLGLPSMMKRPFRTKGMIVIAISCLIAFSGSIHMETNAPGTFVPKTIVPKTLMPDTVIPKVIHEETLMPQTLMPDTVIMEVIAEETHLPQTLMPDTVILEVVAEETLMLETLMPDTVVPEVVSDETLMPDTVVEDMPVAMPVDALSEIISTPTVNDAGFLSETYGVMNSYVQSFMTRVLALFQPRPLVSPADTERLLKAAQGGNTVVELSRGRHVALINVGALRAFQVPFVFLAARFFEFTRVPAADEVKMGADAPRQSKVEVDAVRESKMDPPSVESPIATYEEDSVPQHLFSTLFAKMRSFVCSHQDDARRSPEELADAERLAFAASNSWHSIIGLSGARIFVVLNIEAFGEWKGFVLALAEVLGFVKDIVHN